MNTTYPAGKSLQAKAVRMFAPLMLAQLGLDKVNGELMFVIDGNIADSTGQDCNAVAMQVEGTYVIAIKKSRDMEKFGSSMAHELVHIKQLVTGKFRAEAEYNVWCGKHYALDCPYMSRPWEIQAFQQQEIIFRRCFEMLENSATIQ